MSKAKRNRKWLKEHFDDAFVRRSKEEGFRSRASYKLLAIHDKDHLLKPGMTVVDLGAAPGGWSQVAGSLVHPGGKVIACDVLPMEAIPGVTFIQGDFTGDECFQGLLGALEGRPVDVVISDMAPNLSGMNEIDQPRAMHLAELAADFARQTLRPGGALLTKAFQGEGFEQLLGELREEYATVVNRKPNASRSRSREVYVLGRGYKG